MPMEFHSHRIRKSFRASLALAAAVLSIFALTTISMPIHATEEPEYQIVRELADIEVREYGAYTVSEVVVAGPASEAGGRAFPILAGYIFGKNKGERKLAMTAPVTQAPVPAKARQAPAGRCRYCHRA